MEHAKNLKDDAPRKPYTPAKRRRRRPDLLTALSLAAVYTAAAIFGALAGFAGWRGGWRERSDRVERAYNMWASGSSYSECIRGLSPAERDNFRGLAGLRVIEE